MKKLIFCYDGPLKKTKDLQYYNIVLTNELFERYEVIANDIEIAVRTEEITEDNIQNKSSKINKEKYKVIECPNILSLKGLIVNRNECKKILRKEIEASDYVIARLPSMIGNMSINLAKKLNKPYLIEMVGCPWDAFWNYSLKGKLFAPIMTYMTRKRVKNAPYVLYVTKEFLQKRYPTKGKNINCSNVILNNLNKENLKIRKEKIYNDKEESVKIIATTAAVDVRYKGQEYVIKAIKKLKDQGKIFQYWLIGGGDNSYLKNLAEKYEIENQVEFLGSLPHEKVFEKLKNVDIYIQPSKQEGLPRALIEAMSIGCLCIGAKTGGIPELLDKNYVVRKGNVSDIVNKLKNIETKELLQQAEVNIKKSNEYDAEVLKKRRNNFYKQFSEEYKI